MRRALAISAGLVSLVGVAAAHTGASSQPQQVSNERAQSAKTRTPLVTVKRLIRAGVNANGKLACALVTKDGRSILDASNLAGRRECIRSVNELKPEERDVRLLEARAVWKTHNRARVDVRSEEDGEETTWKFSLIKHPSRGWLVDGADPLTAVALDGS